MAMMTQWQDFLASQGATIDSVSTASAYVAHYGNPEAELQAASGGHILADLSHLGLLQVEGDDAVTFLQGQVTNDIKLLDGTNSHFAGYCNPKGRLLALFLAFAHQGHIHLQFDAALLEAIAKRLKMYVMRSKVVITDVSLDISRFGVAGTNSTAMLQTIFPQIRQDFQVPQEQHGIASLENATLIRLPGTLPRYEIFTPAGNAEALWKQLNEQFTAVGKPVWDYLEINAGIPEIVTATQEAFVPQMINLDVLGGINFKKGCYTGQEIVARTHYLGKVKRRTQLAHIPATGIAPQAGEVISTVNSQDAVGQIVRSAPAPDGGYDVLAEIRLESLESGGLQWQGVALEIQEMPYSLAV